MLFPLVFLAVFALAADAVVVSFTEIQRPRSISRPTQFRFLSAICGDEPCEGLRNILDALYVTTITVGGRSFNVMLNTGSADLWVNASLKPIPSAQTIKPELVLWEAYTDKSNYTGPIAFDTVEFHGVKVNNQSFIYAIHAENDNTALLNITGIIGLGLPGLSRIQPAVQNATGSATAGRPFLGNIFEQNTFLPRYITFLLSRLRDVNQTANDGAFTISETIKGYEAISTEPSNPVIASNSRDWTVPITEIRVGGAVIDLPPSVVSNSSAGPWAGVVVTGATNIFAPATIVSKVFGGIPGASQIKVDNTTSAWVVPCNAEPPSVAFVLGGKQYFINPLDLNRIYGTYRFNEKLLSVCLGGIWAVPPERGRNDLVLGTAFLRSVYTMFNFGNASAPAGAPYIKFLSTYDPIKQPTAFSDTRNVQLRLAPAASAAEIAGILGGDPSYTEVDLPSIEGVTTTSGNSQPLNTSTSAAGRFFVCIKKTVLLIIVSIVVLLR